MCQTRNLFCATLMLICLESAAFELKIGETMDFAVLNSAARIHPQFAAACVNFDDSALRCVRSDMLALFGSNAGGHFPSLTRLQLFFGSRMQDPRVTEGSQTNVFFFSGK